MQRLMLLLLLLLCEQPPFLEIWATGAGELGQLLFLSCPSERRGQPRTAAAHGPHHSLGKDLRGPALPLTSSAPACGLVPLGAGISHPRSPCWLLAPASIAPMPAAKAVGRAWSLQQPRAKGKEVPPQHFPEEGCASKLASTTPTPPSLPAAQRQAKPLRPGPQQGPGWRTGAQHGQEPPRQFQIPDICQAHFRKSLLSSAAVYKLPQGSPSQTAPTRRSVWK